MKTLGDIGLSFVFFFFNQSNVANVGKISHSHPVYSCDSVVFVRSNQDENTCGLRGIHKIH